MTEPRRFETKKSVPFLIDDEEFHVLGAIPAEEFAELLDIQSGMTGEDVGIKEQYVGIKAIFQNTMLPESWERFSARLSDRSRPIDFNLLLEISNWLSGEVWEGPSVIAHALHGHARSQWHDFDGACLWAGFDPLRDLTGERYLNAVWHWLTKDATPDSKAELEAKFAQAVIEEKLAQAADRPEVDEVKTTIGATGRRLPPRPKWWKGTEAADVHNRVAAESLAKANPARRKGRR